MTIKHLVISGGGPSMIQVLGAIQHLEEKEYISLKNKYGGVMRCKVKINDIVQIIGPLDSPNLNLSNNKILNFLQR